MQLDGYELHNLLGRGGMGEVWRATHTRLGRETAIKLIRPEALQADGRRSELVKRFTREARATSKLRSPHTIEIYDYGTTPDGALYYAMELLEGCDLGTLVRHAGPLEPGRVVAILRQACEALAEAHGAGLVHRDIKPGNLFLCRLGTRHDVVKLLDFGLVRLAEAGPQLTQLTRQDAICGTPAFMPPESARGAASFDARSDLYALGCVAFWLLTGRLVFEGSTPMEMLLAHARQPAPAPSDVSEVSTPADLEAIVLQCLAKDPSERPASADVLSAALARCTCATDWTPERANGWWRRHRPEHWGREPSRSPTPSSRHSASPPEPTAATRTVDRLPASAFSNLARERDAFVGRERELGWLNDRFAAGAALVTVLGPGGAGKTRLVRHYGLAHPRSWPGGVWFTDLSEARTAHAIARAVGRTLDINLGSDSSVARIGQALAGRESTLLILDNFEQVADCAQATVGTWLDGAPSAHFLVTSRVRLHLPGEQLVPLAPLELAPAAELFADRARAVRPVFALDDTSRPAVERLVAMLDGLPLAIELAAARCRTMSPTTLIARMAKRWDVLRSRSGRSPRQATLRAAVQWSWELLEPWEREAVAQCSVFQGGFDLAAAEAVVRLDAFVDDAPFLEDVLADLVDRSMLSQRDDGRFSMLRSVQEFGAEQLAPPEPVRARHAAYFADLSDRVAGDAAVDRPRGLIADLDNVLAALHRSTGETSARLALGAAAILGETGPLSSARALLERARSLESLSERTRARIEIALGRVLHDMGDTADAEAIFTELIDRLEPTELEDLQTRARFGLARMRFQSGDMVAVEALTGHADRRAALRMQVEIAESWRRQTIYGDQTLALIRNIEPELIASGDPGLQARAMALRAAALFKEGRGDEMQAALEAAVEPAERAGNLELLLRIQSGLADMYWVTGRGDSCYEALERLLETAREQDLAEIEAPNLVVLAGLQYLRGDLPASIATLQRCVSLSRKLGDVRSEILAMAQLVPHHASIGHFEDAARAWADVNARTRASTLPSFIGALPPYAVGWQYWSGQRQRCLEVARAGLAWVLEVIPHIQGPTILGGLAASTTDATERNEAVERGLALIARGSVPILATLTFHALVIEAALRRGDHAQVLRHADLLEAELSAEPLALPSLVVDRARTLVHEHNDADALHALRSRIEEMGLVPLLGEVDRALSALD